MTTEGMPLGDPSKRYGVILADPPWSYDRSGARGGVDRQYATMTDAEIVALPVEAAAAPDCVLLMWATWPRLRVAFDVIEAWGFEYVSALPWIKVTSLSDDLLTGEPRIDVPYGIGFWSRGASELLTISRRGKVSPASGDMVGLLSPNLQHSRKPDSAYAFAERYRGPRIELFARRRREGWDAWGNQAPDERTPRDESGPIAQEACA